MEFREFCMDDVVYASSLLANRHKKEREIFPILKKEFEDSKNTEKIICDILKRKYFKGVCAYEDNNLVGFILSNIETEGTCRSAFVSYEGLAIADTESPELYRKLYAEISKIWLEYGALVHYVVVPAGYQEVLDAWLRVSFAYEQVYGVNSLTRTEVNIPDNLIIKQADKSDSEELRKISNLIKSHQAEAPNYYIVFPERIAMIREGFAELPEDEDSTTLLAYKKDKLLGFQSACTEEDNTNMMIPENSFELGIAGTIKECRGMGIGSILTKSLFNLFLEKGYENVYQDWSIANLQSSIYWPNKGLKPVAYRMSRRIDERIYWADGVRRLESFNK